MPYNKAETVHAASTDVTYGDLNSDVKIDILDMIRLKSYIKENNTKVFSEKAADVDDDGQISAKDVVKFSMYLLNYTRYILEKVLLLNRGLTNLLINMMLMGKTINCFSYGS